MADTANGSQSPTSNSRRGNNCLRLLAIGFVLVLIGGSVLLWKSYDLVSRKWSEVAGWFQDLPAKLTSQEITHAFRESVTQITSTQGDVLEVATLETDETITKYDMKSMFNDLVYLGTTVSEVRVPVVYRYHIRLSDEWDFQLDGDHCVVRVPSLRPSLPPAVRTEGMQKKSEAGWLRFNAAENLLELEKSLTPTLERRAMTPRHVQLVRESSRQSVADFVKKWLLKEVQAKGTPVKSLTLIFPDEAKKQGSALTLPPPIPLQAP